jgi:[ribosomal protein S18]-alanine N-acetyltransferase
MFIIRNAKKSDLDQILEIENSCYPVPWDRTAFECELSKQASGKNIFLAGEEKKSGKLAGYMAGDVIVDYVHILNIAVAAEFRKMGLATGFMAKAETETLKRGLGALTLEVRENNEAAVNLYKKLGYVVKGRRIKYYENTYDGLLMWKKL